jgi:hypothetical protein
MGDVVNVEEYDSPRAAFASWLTSNENPRFTINIVNRLWKEAFGLAQIEQQEGVTDIDAAELDESQQSPRSGNSPNSSN